METSVWLYQQSTSFLDIFLHHQEPSWTSGTMHHWLSVTALWKLCNISAIVYKEAANHSIDKNSAGFLHWCTVNFFQPIKSCSHYHTLSLFWCTEHFDAGRHETCVFKRDQIFPRLIVCQLQWRIFVLRYNLRPPLSKTNKNEWAG